MGRRQKRIRQTLPPVEVIEELAYLDSIGVVLPKKIPPELFASLRESVSYERKRWRREKIPTANGFYQYNLFLHQPSLESMEQLRVCEQEFGARLLEVHVALDLQTETFAGARLLQNYLESIFLPSGRLKTEAVFRGKGAAQTIYYNKGTRKGTEVKLYSDRASKATGAPCLHIEWRVVGKVALKAAGIKSINDVRRMDFRKFCNQRLSFWRAPSLPRLTHAHAKPHRIKGEPQATSELAASRLIRGVESENGAVVAHNLLLALLRQEREFMLRPKRLFLQESHEWVLPPTNNALWPTT